MMEPEEGGEYQERQEQKVGQREQSRIKQKNGKGVVSVAGQSMSSGGTEFNARSPMCIRTHMDSTMRKTESPVTFLGMHSK